MGRVPVYQEETFAEIFLGSYSKPSRGNGGGKPANVRMWQTVLFMRKLASSAAAMELRDEAEAAAAVRPSFLLVQGAVRVACVGWVGCDGLGASCKPEGSEAR